MRTIVRAGLLIVGNGSLPVRDQVLVIEHGRVQAIESLREGYASKETSARVIDAAEKTVMPGLIDSHVHLALMYPGPQETPVQAAQKETSQTLLLTAARNAQLALAAGITTVRDCGIDNKVILPLRDAIRRGVFLGPDIIASGSPITTTRGHCWPFSIEADNAQELRKAVRKQVKAGVDFIKVMVTGGRDTPGTDPHVSQYSTEELRVVVEEARRHGKKVAAHAIGTPGIRNAVEAGVDMIEHCVWLGEKEGTFEYDNRVVSMMVEKGTYVNHATAPRRFFFDKREKELDESEMEFMRCIRFRQEALKKLRDVGVKILFSTDAIFGRWPTFEEFARAAELMVTMVGLSPLEVITIATGVAAEAIGLGEDRGTIEVGKLADLIILPSDPTQDIRVLRHVDTVIKRGRILAQCGKVVVARARDCVWDLAR